MYTATFLKYSSFSRTMTTAAGFAFSETVLLVFFFTGDAKGLP